MVHPGAQDAWATTPAERVIDNEHDVGRDKGQKQLYDHKAKGIELPIGAAEEAMKDGEVFFDFALLRRGLNETRDGAWAAGEHPGGGQH